jgi:4-amino-4-deoxy-L-arabinose transferase-like glycosyltransferase
MSSRILRRPLAASRRKRDGTSRLALAVLAIVFIVGFGLRYQALAESELPKYPNGDAAKYLLYAYNLKNFGIYSMSGMSMLPADTDPRAARELMQPDALVSPGLPLFLSRFLGGEYTERQRDRILLAQVILSSFTVLLAYLAFAPLGGLPGLGAAVLTAFSPHLVNMNLFFLTEPLFCFFLAAFVWLLSLVDKDSSSPLFLLIGLVFGMAVLTRPWIQGYLLLLLPLLVFSVARVPVRKVLLIVVGAAILVTPWLVRNQLVIGSTTDTTLSFNSIRHGMYPDMKYDDQPESLGYAYQYDPMSAELGKSVDATLAELKRRAADNPGEYLRWYLFGKSKSVLSWQMIAAADAVFVYPANNSPYFSRPAFYLSSYYMQKLHGVLMVLAIAGLLLAWLPAGMQHLDRNGLVFARAMSLLLIYFLVMHSIGAPYPRYSVPMRPILYGMSLLPVLYLVRAIRYRMTATEPRL